MKIEFACARKTEVSTEALLRLEVAAAAICPAVEIVQSTMDDNGAAVRFAIRIDDREVDLNPSEHGEIPPRWLMEAALLRALKPKGLLFLCVANSARSQMGEGAARLLAPHGVRVQSAGSHPTSVRPEAVTVLAEIGIATAAHFSKNVADIDLETVDTVITLCAEEECPLFLGKAIRLHWGLPDPAAVSGDDETRLKAFREVRDELIKRLGTVWPVNA